MTNWRRIGVNMTDETLALLRMLAARKSGRPSLSGVLRELVKKEAERLALTTEPKVRQ